MSITVASDSIKILIDKLDSPYHLDVLNTLFEMKEEGLIKSISTTKFPSSLLQSALGCGFEVYANENDGNLLSTHNHLQNNAMTNIEEQCKKLISSPLAGSLLTSSFSLKEDIRQLTQLEMKAFNRFYGCTNIDQTERWRQYRSIMGTLIDISFKHHVSIESVALRWLLQINSNNMVTVGTKLGMDFMEEKGGPPYRRESELRQVFSFSLDEEDMHRLNDVTDLSKDVQSENSSAQADYIDLTDKSLWL